MDDSIAVIDLFGAEVRRELVAFASDEMTWEDRLRTGEIAECIDRSRESMNGHLTARGDPHGPLVRMGVFAVDSDEDAYFTHFVLADTPVTHMLRRWDGYPIEDLLSTMGRQKLVQWFLVSADAEHSYSRNGIQDGTGANYSTVADHIDVLVESGLVTEVDGARGTEYQLDVTSEIYEFLVALNEAVYEHFTAYDPED